MYISRGPNEPKDDVHVGLLPIRASSGDLTDTYGVQLTVSKALYREPRITRWQHNRIYHQPISFCECMTVI